MQFQPFLTAEAHLLQKQGHSYKVIARMINCDPFTIKKRVGKARRSGNIDRFLKGDTYVQKRALFTVEQLVSAYEMKSEGLSWPKVAERMLCNYEQLYQAIKHAERHGIAARLTS
ncbi:hypothetical protein VPH49_26375 [Pseudomonas luteola]|uniref:hypothetical protein n=1 Tax=Pseudomonas luteola TaxID=47886 RepID=UPI003A88CEB2